VDSTESVYDKGIREGVPSNMETLLRFRGPGIFQKSQKGVRMISVKETLKRAKRLIRDKKNWMQGDSDNGDPYQGVEPTRFCAMGALNHVDGPNEQRAIWVLEQACDARYGTNEVASINDGRDGHKRILVAFDDAIKVAGKPSRLRKALEDF
jgi:hypothetical protein